MGKQAIEQNHVGLWQILVAQAFPIQGALPLIPQFIRHGLEMSLDRARHWKENKDCKDNRGNKDQLGWSDRLVRQGLLDLQAGLVPLDVLDVLEALEALDPLDPQDVQVQLETPEILALLALEV